uniref:Direct IAP-binding protein with low pI n=1 Tax=Neogobius melanostomus TaxID=47308 RepID=A0A8C6T6K2_9GOBI
MAALRQWRTYLSVLRRSSRGVRPSLSPAAQRTRTVRNAVFTSVSAVAAGASLCAIPFKQDGDLSHESLIRRAASLATDSSSTFLSQTTLALIEAVTQYSKAVHTLIGLHRRYLDSLGKWSSAEEDSVWQVIIGQRAQINERREEVQRLELTWASAVRLCEAAAEAAFSSGAEQACITVKTHLDLAHRQAAEVRKLAADADKLLMQTKVLEVERVAQHAEEEEEVPEAYLRED